MSTVKTGKNATTENKYASFDVRLTYYTATY